MTAPSIPLFARPFYFLRHGETTSNLQKTIAGSTDVALTARGQEQAREAAVRLKRCGITAIYSSALQRARDTAAEVGRELGLAVTVLPGLNERSWGVLEGTPRSARVRGGTPRGAETPEAFAARVLNALREVDAAGTPLVVAHSGVYRVLCRTLGLEEGEAPVANCLPVRIDPHASGGGWKAEVSEPQP